VTDDAAETPQDITVDDAVEIPVDSIVEAELTDLADGLDQAAIEELLLEEPPFGSLSANAAPVIEEIELEPLLPFDSDPSSDSDIGLLLEVPLSISVELGRTSLTIRELLALGVLVNGKRLARGEVVVIDEDFGIRVTEVVTPEERISGMGR